jgi:hypothetical protein
MSPATPIFQSTRMPKICRESIQDRPERADWMRRDAADIAARTPHSIQKNPKIIAIRVR